MPIAVKIDHVAIAAEDTAAMARWYERVLGLVIHLESGPTAPQTQKVFMIGPPVAPADAQKGLRQGSMIEVMPRNETPRHDRNSHEPGLSHVAWHVQDFDAALAHLREQKVHFLSEVIQAIGGGRLISFADNEGNMMQILERK
jgi:catechol 2,3-dioxygenase-like lactoylglutathione lyase family enzyme